MVRRRCVGVVLKRFEDAEVRRVFEVEDEKSVNLVTVLTVVIVLTDLRVRGKDT